MRLWYQVKGKDFVYNGEDDEPIDYFLTILPRMKHHALKTGSAARTVVLCCSRAQCLALRCVGCER
jgi:hypothetical protein